MTALYTIGVPVPPIDGPGFAVVADDSGAHYVFPDGSSDSGGLNDERIQTVAKLSAVPVVDAATWLGVACSNMTYLGFSDPEEAADIEAATAAASAALADLASTADVAEPNADTITSGSN